MGVIIKDTDELAAKLWILELSEATSISRGIWRSISLTDNIRTYIYNLSFFKRKDLTENCIAILERTNLNYELQNHEVTETVPVELFNLPTKKN